MFSLNILSQLEVAFQEGVEPILEKRFGRAFVQQRQHEWLDAVCPASQVLAEQHLAAFESSNAQFALLIADVEYVEYTGRQYSRKRFEPSPLSWSDAGWLADPGIKYEATPALQRVELNLPTFARWMPSYRLEWPDTWLWHIAPNSTEATPNGKLNRVAAFALWRY